MTNMLIKCAVLMALLGILVDATNPHFKHEVEQCSSTVVEVDLSPVDEDQEATTVVKTLQSENKGNGDPVYEINSDCKWNVKPAAGHSVQIIAANVDGQGEDEPPVDRLLNFDVETSVGCYKDYVEITEGSKTKRWCGKNLYEPIKWLGAKDAELSVNFASDRAGNQPGFILHLTNDPHADDDTPPARVCGLDSVLNEANPEYSIFPNPDNKNNYENNLDCQWTITTSVEGKVIKLAHTTPFIVEQCGEVGEYSVECLCDFMEINGKTFCGAEAVLEDNYGTDVKISFSSDGSVNGQVVLKASLVDAEKDPSPFP